MSLRLAGPRHGKPRPLPVHHLGPRRHRHLMLARQVAAPSSRRPASPRRTLPPDDGSTRRLRKLSMLSAMSPMRPRRTGSLAQAGNLGPVRPSLNDDGDPGPLVPAVLLRRPNGFATEHGKDSTVGIATWYWCHGRESLPRHIGDPNGSRGRFDRLDGPDSSVIAPTKTHSVGVGLDCGECQSRIRLSIG